jgi:hypothetical protein
MSQRKTGQKWSTQECTRCGEAHENYSVKLDKDNIPYVVCGSTHKRVDLVDPSDTSLPIKRRWWADGAV